MEETVTVKVTASNDNEAVAASNHMLEGGLVDWKYDRTIETTSPNIEVTEVK